MTGYEKIILREFRKARNCRAATNSVLEQVCDAPLETGEICKVAVSAGSVKYHLTNRGILKQTRAGFSRIANYSEIYAYAPQKPSATEPDKIELACKNRNACLENLGESWCFVLGILKKISAANETKN